MPEAGVQSLSWEDPLQKEMATHFSIFAWEIPWIEEPGRLQSIRLQRVRPDLATKQQYQQNYHLEVKDVLKTLVLSYLICRW